MAWVVARVMLDGSGEPGGMPDEIFGPFKSEEVAERWAKMRFEKDNGFGKPESGDSCRCGECVDLQYTDEDGNPAAIVNFVVFELRSTRNYTKHY